MEETEEVLRMQEIEKEYTGMKVDQLMAIAQKEKVDTKGDKDALINRLLNKAAGKTKSSDQILLEEAIMSWSSKDMQEYLQDMKKPTWGAKAVMTERIISYINIDDAVEITKEYRVYLAAVTETTEEETETNTGMENEVDERKRKRDGRDGRKETEEEEENDNKMVDSEDEADKLEEEEEKKNICAPRRRRVIDDENGVATAVAGLKVKEKEKEKPPPQECVW